METIKPSSFKFEWNVGHALIALPLFNLLCGALLLIGYCSGFGASLIRLAEPEDVVITSLQDMWLVVSIYLVFPTVAFVSGRSHGKSRDVRIATLSEEVDQLSGNVFENEGEREVARTKLAAIISELGTHSRALERGRFAMPLLVLASSIGLNTWLYSVAGRIFAVPAVLTFMGLVMLSEGVNPRLIKLDLWKIWMVVIGGMFLLGTGAYGFDTGTTHRRLAYKDVANRVRCGNGAVLRKLAGGYLVVLPSSEKAIVDKECSIVFSVPRMNAENSTTAPASSSKPPTAIPRAGPISPSVPTVAPKSPN